eukprot:CAMPEP_0115029422 /NCGR_PEP_ID=MMETSP0216-20121206/36991_1 /TAXON_ID=223996 /ORGANISM="Protocruzia adherens, Strain Boccale" /LENGTH=412 /DNA_ID=CAMNT_0002406003 /DNA_START=199 /DNA_END=1437 /DNA_ORIENTATION=+
MDFFSNLNENHQDIRQPQQLLQKMLSNQLVQHECPTVEEVYSALVMVYDDMMLNDLEAATWWTILEVFGFCDAEIGFTRTAYCAAFAAKHYLKSNTAVDVHYVQSNIDENFGNIYQIWSQKRAQMTVPVEKMNAYFSSIPQFLNKNRNYDSVVDNLLFESCDDGDVNPVDIINTDPIFKTAEEKKREILRMGRSNQENSPSWRSDSTADSMSQTGRRSLNGSHSGQGDWDYLRSNSGSGVGSSSSNSSTNGDLRAVSNGEMQDEWWYNDQNEVSVQQQDGLEELLMNSLCQSRQHEVEERQHHNHQASDDLLSQVMELGAADMMMSSSSTVAVSDLATNNQNVVMPDPRLSLGESSVKFDLDLPADRFWENKIGGNLSTLAEDACDEQQIGVEDTLDFIFASTSARKGVALF